MPYPLDEHVESLLNDPSAVKVLATTDKNGVPHAVMDSTIHADANGSILYLERVESSVSQSDLVSSLWFKRQVAITVSKGEEQFLLLGRPVKSVICGPLFEHYYRQTVQNNPEADLSTVWIIEPDSVSDQSLAERIRFERETRPLITHLDRWACQ